MPNRAMDQKTAAGSSNKSSHTLNAPESASLPGQITRAGWLNHPALRKLDELARQVTNIGLAVVFPKEQGWEHTWFNGNGPCSPYCQLFFKNAEGAKHCKMCHILITIASCSQGVREHRCHTGVSVLVAPVRPPQGEAAAVLSNCVFISGPRNNIWAETRSRGKKLGLNLRKLQKEFLALPEPSAEKKELIQLILEAAAQMIAEISQHHLMEQELSKLRNRLQGRDVAPSAVERALSHALKMRLNQKSASSPPGARHPDHAGRGNQPAIVKVVSDLVNRRPDLSFSLNEIAHAARLTPNYFSALFRRHAREKFSDFLLRRRIELAQEYLRDNTLNISEVAFKVGFDDPGYFIRCFKRRLGQTPGAWRTSLS